MFLPAHKHSALCLPRSIWEYITRPPCVGSPFAIAHYGTHSTVYMLAFDYSRCAMFMCKSVCHRLWLPYGQSSQRVRERVREDFCVYVSKNVVRRRKWLKNGLLNEFRFVPFVGCRRSRDRSLSAFESAAGVLVCACLISRSIVVGSKRPELAGGEYQAAERTGRSPR